MLLVDGADDFGWYVSSVSYEMLFASGNALGGESIRLEMLLYFDAAAAVIPKPRAMGGSNGEP